VKLKAVWVWRGWDTWEADASPWPPRGGETIEESGIRLRHR